MTLSDLEWFIEIFNDTKHRAVSLQQLSFLWFMKSTSWRGSGTCTDEWSCHTSLMYNQIQHAADCMHAVFHTLTVNFEHQLKYTWLATRWRCHAISSKQKSAAAFCRAMLCQRGLCRHAVSVSLSVCLYVRLSVTFVNSVKTNKVIFKICSPSDSPTILVFPHKTSR